MNKHLKIANLLMSANKESNGFHFLTNEFFDEYDLKDITEHIPTTNIEAVSKKQDPELYEKLYSIYENDPSETIGIRSPNTITGVKSFKEINGNTVACFRDAEKDDYLIVAPQGTFNMMLNQDFDKQVLRRNRASIIAAALVLSSEDWFNLPESDDLKDLLWALYELEYKYSQMKAHKNEWLGTPQRYENTLNKMDKKLLNITQDIAENLEPVFRNWLSQHAITDPKRWAEARLESAKQDSDYSSIIYEMKSEFQHYAGNDFSRACQDLLLKNIDKIPALRDYLDDYIEEEKQNIEDDKENMDEDEYTSRMEYIRDRESTLESLFDIYGNFEEFMASLNNWSYDDLDDILLIISEKLIFPAWYKKWKAEGIDETRSRIEKRYDEIQQLTSGSISDPQKAAGMINSIIQESHQTGSMMDYIDQEYNVGYNFLEELSGLDVEPWKKELKSIGLKVAKKNDQ